MTTLSTNGDSSVFPRQFLARFQSKMHVVSLQDVVENDANDSTVNQGNKVPIRGNKKPSLCDVEKALESPLWKVGNSLNDPYISCCSSWNGMQQ